MRAHLYGNFGPLVNATFLDTDEYARRGGWNTGNSLFWYANSQIFATGAEAMPWSGDMRHLSPAEDRLIIPLANQLGPHIDLGRLAELIEKVNMPMLGIGLGIQGRTGRFDVASVPEGTWRWVEAIINKAPNDSPNLTLRGDLTHAALTAKGFGDRCVVTGCASNFINPSASLGYDIHRRRANHGLKRVAVAAGNPMITRLRKLEHSLVKLVETHDGCYICQHPIDLLRMVTGEALKISRENFLRLKDYIKPTLDDVQFIGWFRRYAHAFCHVPEWIDMIRQYDFVVGTRIHGVMAGLQAGRPALCLCIDARTLELCQTMAIPHADAKQYREGIILDEIAALFSQWDWQKYDETRQALARRLHQFALANDIELQGPLKNVM